MESAPDLPPLNKPKLYRTRHPERSPFFAVLNQFFDRCSREYELRFERLYRPQLEGLKPDPQGPWTSLRYSRCPRNPVLSFPSGQVY
jgi:hypothetical protein